MGNNKSTPIIVLGLAVFIVGGALLFLVLRHNNNNSSKSASKSSVATTTSTLSPGAVVIPAASTPTTIAFKIPNGLNALSLQMNYYNGVGGFAQPNDTVNIYAILNKDCKDPKNFPLQVSLVASNIKVLEVLGSPPAATGGTANFLLAVTPQQAAELIFFRTGFELYYTLTTPGEAPAAPTGFTCTNA